MQALAGKAGPRVVATLLAVVGLMIVAAVALSSSASGDATASRTVTVAMKNNFFSPKNVTISKGDKVVWSNSSGRTHNATRRGSFSVSVKPGKAAALKFTSKGTYGYVCTLHAGMTGKIVVD